MNSIILYRVQAIVSVDVSTLSHSVRTEEVRRTTAHIICPALPRSIRVDGPVKRIYTVVHYLISQSAELILFTNKEVDADDREYSEDEDLEDADIEQAGDRVNERLNELPHSF